MRKSALSRPIRSMVNVGEDTLSSYCYSKYAVNSVGAVGAFVGNGETIRKVFLSNVLNLQIA